jgi:CheY-like chemotaxis protein
MSHLVKKEWPLQHTFQETHEQFHRAIEAVNTGECIDFAPATTVAGLLRVLIVGDSRTTSDTLSSLVTLWGHHVRSACDGVTALALTAAFQPDVMLLDVLLPPLSGIEVTELMRQQDRLKHCFIVAITSRTDLKHRRRCYEAGIDLVLSKPIVPSHIQTLLMLESQRLRSRKDAHPSF